MPLAKYQDVINYLNKNKRPKHLLLGNGFSIAYDSKIFSYNALSDFVAKTKDKLLQKLFSVINTTNFEIVMSQLDTFQRLASEFAEDQKLARKILKSRDSLKQNLVEAISELHPEHVFKIPVKSSRACATFLKQYLDSDGHVFSTNYDLLLYWVLMNNQAEISNIVDGFGRERIDNNDEEGAEPEYGDLEWGPNQTDQHVHYVHGALHIFDAGISIQKEIYKDNNYLLTNIKRRIDNREYPVFVTAGDGRQKLEHIFHNPYLVYCYRKLSTITGSLVVFGFGFGKHDEHIIEAINKAAKQDKRNRLWSIYIGIYADKDEKYVNSIISKFKCKVHLFDSKTANLWN